MPSSPKKQFFPQTQWSLVGRAASKDQAVRLQAMEQLLQAYIPGLRSFLVDHRHIRADLVDDLLQAFVADKILADGWVGQADRSRGKFRNYVLKSLSNFVNSEFRKRKRQSKTMDELAQAVAMAGEGQCDHVAFNESWTRQLVAEALAGMEKECRENERMDMWEVFELRVAKPAMQDVPTVGYDVLMRRLGMKSPRAVINLLANAKRMFVRHLRAVVGRYALGDRAIDAEIAELREFLK